MSRDIRRDYWNGVSTRAARRLAKKVAAKGKFIKPTKAISRNNRRP